MSDAGAVAPRTLLAATSNTHKLRELKRLLPGWTVLGFRDLAGTEGDPACWDVPPEDVVESGATFLDNAVLKALHASQGSSLPVVADDSGLCVDRLLGAPGVLSARHGGPGLDDRRRYELVLKQMEGVPDLMRGASYRAVLVLARHGRVLSVHDGACAGRLLTAPRGEGGFGYDPIFLVAGLDKTMAELSPDEKDAVSHRARAAAGLCVALEQGASDD